MPCAIKGRRLSPEKREENRKRYRMEYYSKPENIARKKETDNRWYMNKIRKDNPITEQTDAPSELPFRALISDHELG